MKIERIEKPQKKMPFQTKQPQKMISEKKSQSQLPKVDQESKGVMSNVVQVC